MSLNFFRRVAFGLSPSDKKPDDPLPWALNQLNTVPEFLWPGSIPTEKELSPLDFRAEIKFLAGD